jgi:hypothetical protein
MCLIRRALLELACRRVGWTIGWDCRCSQAYLRDIGAGERRSVVETSSDFTQADWDHLLLTDRIHVGRKDKHRWRSHVEQIL